MPYNQPNVTIEVLAYETIGHQAPYYEVYIVGTPREKAIRCADTLVIGHTYTGTITYHESIIDLAEFTPDF